MAKDSQHWLGFDLGGTKMFAVVFDENRKIIGSDRRATEGHKGVESGVERICETINAALEDAGITKESLWGIGMGCPGIVDMQRGVLQATLNLGWPEVPLKRLISKKFKCPVAVMNDVDAGTYGEYIAGAGKGAHTLLGVFPGTGVGGGCVYDGRLLRGKRFSAMEIGRICWPVPELGSGPGEWPIFEKFCSRLAIASAVAGEAFRGKAPNLLKKAGTEVAKIKSKVISGSYKAKDPGTVSVVNTAITHLAAGVGSTVNLLAPDVLVLGGGLVEAMPELFIKRMTEELPWFVPEELTSSLKIRQAKLGDDATVTGAAFYAAGEFSE